MIICPKCKSLNIFGQSKCANCSHDHLLLPPGGMKWSDEIMVIMNEQRLVSLSSRFNRWMNEQKETIVIVERKVVVSEDENCLFIFFRKLVKLNKKPSSET